MRILVTGGLGFVGSAVSARLADAGHRVVALARTPRADQPPHPAVQVVYGDLLDAERVDEIIAAGGFDGGCHLAGRVRVRESFADPAGYWQANVNGIANLLAVLARATERSGQPVRLVFASAGAIYGSGHEKPIS